MDTTLEGGFLYTMTVKTEAEFSATLARLEEKIDGIKEDVSDLNHKMFGNGSPGLLLDQQAQDNKIEQLLGYAKTNAENIKKLDEVSTPNFINKYWWKITLIAIFVLILVHSLIPENVTIWQLLQLIR